MRDEGAAMRVDVDPAATTANDKKNSSSTSEPGSSNGDGTTSSAEATTTTSPAATQITESARNPSFQSFNDVVDLVFNPLRSVISQNRRRYTEDGFNLDLTYITDRIIAMGYPAKSIERLYRNSMCHTVKFLERNHAGHYKVFNLRGNYFYKVEKFHGRVGLYHMKDHHPPRLDLMDPFCKEVNEYLKADPRNVVAVHCKAGKGRTGVMICAYLVSINFYNLPRQVMDYYSIVRTVNNKGVTIPSQRRYVYYYAQMHKHNLVYTPLRIELVGVYVERPPQPGVTFKGDLVMRVAQGDIEMFKGAPITITRQQWSEEEKLWAGKVPFGEDSYDPSVNAFDAKKTCVSRRAWGWSVTHPYRVYLEGDIRVDIFAETPAAGSRLRKNKKKREKIGHVWLNTMFTCPGSCGGGYRHGDEISPYPEGATSITERRTSAPSTSGATNVGQSAAAAVPSSPPAPGTIQFDGHVPCLRRDMHALSAECDRTTLGFAVNEQRKSSEPVGHHRSFLTKMNVRKSHSSDPHMTSSDSAQGNEGHKKRKTQSSSERWEATKLELKLPPGLEEHCPSSSLADIYGDPTKAPRHGIEELLRNAHTSDIVRDFYNERRRALPTSGEPVESAPEGRPEASGPALIRRGCDEHVHVFPLIEVDRAFKDESMPPGFKIIIITRCIHSQDPVAQEKAETALADARRVAAKHEEEKQNKHKKSINCPPANVPVIGSGPLRTATSWPKCPLQAEQSSSSSLGASVAFPAKPGQWEHTASSSSSVSECADEPDERVLHMSGLNVGCEDTGVVFGNPGGMRAGVLQNGAAGGGNSSPSDSSGDLTSAMDSTFGDGHLDTTPPLYSRGAGKMYVGDSDGGTTTSPRAKRPLFS
ncbi:hypothetical protein Y032_0122g1047 [Ancylostoma ceylanicum]|uniref:Uncharacterized protein n=2 Tax=Ancylostoma ceylanicum TaxID=53326 RepID=A0A016T9U3_9BILA|nr:hypothetical protein Y032_0122g1047 [Ancylostoma ceylanicum]